MRYFKTMGLCLVAMFIISAVIAGNAVAARPAQPVFTTQKGGVPNEPIPAAGVLKVEDSSLRSRLWAINKEVHLIIVCEKDISTGELESKGRNKGEVTFSECKVAEAKENAAKQWEEGEPFKGCTVPNIVVKNLKSRLVWAAGVNTILVLYEPTTQPFVVIKIEGKECLVKGEYEVRGSVLALPALVNTEAIAGLQSFLVTNGASEVRQAFTKWEVKEGTGSLESGTAELTLKLGAKEIPAALESTEQVERVKEGGLRGLFGIHE